MKSRQPKSACDVVKEMLERPLYGREYNYVNKSEDANIEHLNDFDRAKTACQLDMVVTPSSANKSRFFTYTTRDRYQELLEKEKEPQPQKSFFARFGNNAD